MKRVGTKNGQNRLKVGTQLWESITDTIIVLYHRTGHILKSSVQELSGHLQYILVGHLLWPQEAKTWIWSAKKYIRKS